MNNYSIVVIVHGIIFMHTWSQILAVATVWAFRLAYTIMGGG